MAEECRRFGHFSVAPHRDHGLQGVISSPFGVKSGV
jgi:hypothetical protein